MIVKYHTFFSVLMVSRISTALVVTHSGWLYIFHNLTTTPVFVMSECGPTFSGKAYDKQTQVSGFLFIFYPVFPGPVDHTIGSLKIILNLHIDKLKTVNILKVM